MSKEGWLPMDEDQTLGTVRAIIFDVDNTLVFAKDAAFYRQYTQKVDEAISDYFGVDADQARQIADTYRLAHGGGEQALFLGDVANYFPDISSRQPDYTTLYDHMVQIDPQGQFHPQHELRRELQELRSKGVRLGLLTSSPDSLSRAILQDSGFDVDTDFDAFLAYERENGPPKMLQPERAFAELAKRLGVLPETVLAVGDLFRYDVLPAQNLNMIGCLLSDQPPSNFNGLTAQTVSHVIAGVNKAITQPKNR